MNKIVRIEKYLFDFFSSRFEDLDIFHMTTYDKLGNKKLACEDFQRAKSLGGE